MTDQSKQQLPALHELEMLSPWFDASSSDKPGIPPPRPIEGPRRLLLLLSAPRNGSYHLCRHLWHLGYGMPAEYFNPHLNPGWERFAPHHSLFQRILRRLRRQRQPLRPDRTWLKRLVLERSARSLLTGQPFFAAKLQPQQLGPLPAALQCSFAPLAESLLWAPFQLVPPALVLLYRQDWLAALLSHHLALCTGSFDQGRVFSFQLRPITNLGSREALLSDLASYRSHIESLVETLECTPYPIHCLTFEHLLRDQPATLARLIRAIEPPDQPLAQLEQHPSLAVQIQRAPNPWSADHRAWKRHLHQRFLEEGLDRHPNALACAAAIAALNHFSNP